MKKAMYVLLPLLGLFFAMVIGIFVGRNSVSGMVVIPEVSVSQKQSADESAAPSEVNLESAPVIDGKININAASVSLLQMVPNIGPVLAQRIVDYRNDNGSYTVVEELLSVEGIGEKGLEQIREYITVGG